MGTDWAELGWIRTGRAGLLEDQAGPPHTDWTDPPPMLIRKKWEPIRLAGKRNKEGDGEGHVGPPEEARDFGVRAEGVPEEPWS
ncbi:hypothetical protein CDL15_Pgr010824 [Punica granatum]|uniref:Uncharacterized protein n=1 Tax=Punica granatum TaxID=22663 RepID=A0A218W5G5_PUNGR|nr:hypothetical protein CDL15_Pgr010824 [Punica granatum]